MTNATNDTPYRVLITRDLTESATVVVRATSPEEAIRQATSYAYENPDSSTDPHYMGYPDFGVFRVSDTRGVILV